MINFEKWWYNNEKLIEEGVRLTGSIAHTNVILDIDNDTPFDVCFTTQNNSCFIKDLRSTVSNDKYSIVDSLYAPYIIYDDAPAEFVKYDKNTNKYKITGNTTNKAGVRITSPIYHTFKNDLLIPDSDDIDIQLDDKFKKTNDYAKKFKNLTKLNYFDVNTFINTATSKYKNIVDEYLKCTFNTIQFPDSKSKHVKNISHSIQSKLQLSNPEKLSKLTNQQLYNKYFGNIPKIIEIYNIAINSFNTTKPATPKEANKQILSILVNVFDNLVVLYKTPEGEGKNIIDKCFNNISYDPHTRINQSSRTYKYANNITNIPRIDVYKLYLIASWIVVLASKLCKNSATYAQVSSANDIRNIANLLHNKYNGRYTNIAKNVASKAIQAIDTYSYGYYNNNTISPITQHNSNELNILLVDDNINLGSTIFTLTHQIKEHYSKLYPNHIIKCHWFVLFMPINDYNNIYSKRSDIIIAPKTHIALKNDISTKYNDVIVKNKNITHISTSEMKQLTVSAIKDCKFANKLILPSDEQYAKLSNFLTTNSIKILKPLDCLPIDKQSVHRKTTIDFNKLFSGEEGLVPTTIRNKLTKTTHTIKQLLFLPQKGYSGTITNQIYRLLGFNTNIPPSASDERIKEIIKQRIENVKANSNIEFINKLNNDFNNGEFRSCYNIINNRIKTVIANLKLTKNEKENHSIKYFINQLISLYIIATYYNKNIQLIEQAFETKITNNKTSTQSYKQFYRYFIMFNLLRKNIIAGYTENCKRYHNQDISLQISNDNAACNIVNSKPESNTDISFDNYVLNLQECKYILNDESHKELSNGHVSPKHILEKRQYVKSGNYSKKSPIIENELKNKCTNILNRKFVVDEKLLTSEKIKNSKLKDILTELNNLTIFEACIMAINTINLTPAELLIKIMRFSNDRLHNLKSEELSIKNKNNK